VDRPAPSTFASKTDAERWLARVEVEIHDDHWRDPDLGRESFGEYAAAWIKERPGLTWRLSCWRRLPPQNARPT